MPLHLLGKKSWNVYNQDNIEKVKRDEAVAKAKEEADEQRMQEIDAARRIQILRGEIPAPLAIAEKGHDVEDSERRPHGSGRERKKRKRVGEDDTDFEMRVAKQKEPNPGNQIVLRNPTADVPLVDRSGHIDLFPQEHSRSIAKNPEAEKELAKKKKEYEDQYTMKFSNAAGFKQGLQNPWYSKSMVDKAEAADEIPTKDVWGNEDPRRKERQVARTVSNDPLAAMRQGAAKVREVEKERKKWKAERERETLELLEEEAARKRRKRRHHHDTEAELESFSLDGPERSSLGDRRHKKRSRHDDPGGSCRDRSNDERRAHSRSKHIETYRSH